jgi:hypothetical protein
MNDHRPTETPTPRTDAETWIADSISDPDGIPVVRADVCKAIELENATLTAQLEEARRDSARLDWLEAQCVDIFVDESPIERRNGMSLRQAIDAALTERKEKVE